MLKHKLTFIFAVVAGIATVWAYVTLTPKQAIAPDFELLYYPSKRPLKLSSTHNRVVLLNFWSSWCKACRNEKQFLNTFKQEYPDVLVLEVLTFDDEAEIGNLARPFLYDLDNSVANLYKVSSVPQTFLIDKARRIRWHTYNPIDTSALKAINSYITTWL